MAAVYKYRQCSLESIIPLLIVILLVLFVHIPFALSTSKRHIRRMAYSGNEKMLDSLTLSHTHKLERRISPEVKTTLPKRKIPIVRAQTRSRATLHCNISEVIEKENATLSWLKKANNSDFFAITTLDQVFVIETNTTTTGWVGDDKRYLAKQVGSDWCLQIRYTMNSDAGMYQCQICHGFPPSAKCSANMVSLKLTEARANIIGGPKFIPSDKELPLRLSCVLINSIEPPSYIFWYHGDRMINYDLEDGATVREGPQGSELIFPKANKTHVGNYSCVPSNAQLDSVMVYYGVVILSGTTEPNL